MKSGILLSIALTVLGCSSDLRFFETVPSRTGTGIVANACADDDQEVALYTHSLVALSMSSIVGDSDRVSIQAAWTTSASPG
ncbi:MAG: hypothetical protein AAFY60_21500, partial [Myxococcota bacterium]